MSSADDLVSTTAAALMKDAAGLSEQLVAQMVHEIPELGDDRAMVDLLAASVSENLRSALQRFALGQRRPDAEAPVAALEYARRLAQRGIPVSALLRAYRLGQAESQKRMMEGFAAVTQDPAVIVEASIQLSAASFAYVDSVSEQMVRAHDEERQRWLRTRAVARSAQVTAVLAGQDIDAVEAERALSYAFGQPHLGVVLWSEPAAGPDSLARLERAASRLADEAGCRREPLVIPADACTVWAWLPRPRAAIEADGPAMHEERRVHLALGDVAEGVEGFRSTHHQARRAQAVAVAADPAHRPRVTKASEVEMVALLSSDLAATREWVFAVLGDLALDDEPHRRLRETLWVFLSARGSYTAAAAELMLHKNTVQYRVRKAEEARGRSLKERRLDVEVALLACRWLGSKVLRNPVLEH
ncbi:helix-turn-helix domain-containing protein [Nocardioides sp.]|uniref:PucR family transcriptional regulator n=1 Tax=Nocardioides sp. TaxID=35761 RepID=UPI0031FE8115|nr:hypothetical protein [Nocardioides sp.]